MPLLEVNELTTYFAHRGKHTTVVDRIDLNVEQGETVGIVGESGCGKSVTSLSIMRLLQKNGHSTGSVYLDGIDILSLDEREMQRLRGNKLSMIFQEPMTSLNPLHTIGKQISEPLMRHLKLNKKQAKEQAIALLKEVGIPRPERVYNEYPHQLSGGMRQRVMIAIAIGCNPKLIIADEPTTALDVTIQAQILELMKSLKTTHQTAIMLITHDLGVVAEMCDRVVVMYAGQVVEEADVITLFRSPKHPYTIGLIKSMPSVAEDKDKLESIVGSVPLPQEMPQGCRFAPRCPHVMEKCLEQMPQPLSLSDHHHCRCWLYEEEQAHG